MFKRPNIRIREPCTTISDRPKEGTFLHSIIRPLKCPPYERDIVYMQNYDNYIDNLRKSYEENGIKFSLPKGVLPLPKVEPSKPKNGVHINFIEDVVVKLNVLKCGKVKVKLFTQMATLYEKYFSKNKLPPVKTLATALKAVGYDEEYVSSLVSKVEKNKNDMNTRYKKLELLFNKPSSSSKKKKKEPEPEQEEEPEEEPDEDENEDDDAAPDEEAIDGGDDEDEDENVVEEEEYFSDIE